MRGLRLWEKKRGERRTGGGWLGNLGMALFHSILFLIGALSLASLLEVYSAGGIASAMRDWKFWLGLLVSASFVLTGGVGFVRTVWIVSQSDERRSAFRSRTRGQSATGVRALPQVPDDAQLTNSPGTQLAFRLPSLQTPAWRFFALALFALVWNGAGAVLTVMALDRVAAGQPDWGLIALVGLFLGVGVWLVVAFFRQLLLHTGLGPSQVEISAHPLVPGEHYEVFLSQAGRINVTSLELCLVCEEHAIYRQGTDVRMECCLVHYLPLLRREELTLDPLVPLEEHCRVAIPPHAMHSFQANSNAVLWKLVVKCESPGWPTYERAFPVVVRPRSVSPARS